MAQNDLALTMNMKINKTTGKLFSVEIHPCSYIQHRLIYIYKNRHPLEFHFILKENSVL